MQRSCSRDGQVILGFGGESKGITLWSLEAGSLQTARLCEEALTVTSQMRLRGQLLAARGRSRSLSREF